MYWKTRNERLCKKVLDAWLIYKSEYVKAKSYWNRLYLRLDIAMKKTAMRKW